MAKSANTHSPRLFADDAAVRRVGEAMVVCTLPKADWTHEAHLATCLWLVRERPDIQPESDLPGLIRRYNESVGGVNDDHQGYHETLTQLYIAGVRAFDRESPMLSLVDAVNMLLTSARGRRDWPLRFYTRERLFSVEARRAFIAPDQGDLASV